MCPEIGGHRGLLTGMNLRKLEQLILPERKTESCTPLHWKIKGVPGTMCEITGRIGSSGWFTKKS